MISDCESSDSESAVGNLSSDEDLSDRETDNDDKEAWDSGEQAKSMYIEQYNVMVSFGCACSK